MAYIPVPNGISLCFQFETAGQHWQFCFTLRKSSGAPTDTDLTDVATIGSGWWTSDLKPIIGTGSTLKQIVATDLTTQGGLQHIEPVNQAGTGGTGNAALNAALVLSLRTAKRGRSYRGRAYIGGLPQSDLADAVTVTSGTASAVIAAFGSLQSDLDTAGFDIVVASKQHNKVVTTPAEVNEVTGVVVDTLLDSQRRRLSGRGT